MGALLLVCVLFVGCGKSSASSIAAIHSQLLTTSSLEKDWDTATTAMRTNGYMVAITILRKMQTENPSAGQLGAIDDTLRELNIQMFAAAAKGDANASRAAEELRKMSRSPGS